MKTTAADFSLRVACLIALALAASPIAAASPPAQDGLYGNVEPAVSSGRKWFNSVDDYKRDAARKIAHSNRQHTFEGKLPRVLPAVVVLRVTVDAAGRIIDLWVQRAPEYGDVAADIALTSMYRTAILPRPLNLVNAWNRTLSFSETFLFNEDDRFQIRSLAPVQTAD